MIEDDAQLAAALFQMASCADALEGMRRYAQETGPSAFSATTSGYLHLLRERIAEARQYLEGKPTRTDGATAPPPVADLEKVAA